MGCAHKAPTWHACAEKMIQLVLADSLLEAGSREQLTEHVLGVLQRNARVGRLPEPSGIAIIRVEPKHNHPAATCSGEKMADITYRIL